MSDVDILEDHREQDAELNLVVDMSRFREDPIGFMKTLSQHVVGSSWRGYDTMAGHDLYYPGISDETLSETMNHPILQKAINDLADLRMEQEKSWILSPAEKAARRAEYVRWISSIAEELVDGVMVKFEHKSVLRFMYYVVGQIFVRCYHQGVHVNSEEINRIKAKAKELEKAKQSLIFLPCHKSHIDYMAMQFICFRMGISLPVVVAGENLNIAVLGPMMKQVGGMYIRRGQWSQDYLYTAVVQAFMQTVLKEGYNFECFVEGTRSRTGKLLPPKFGILKYILDAILSGAVQDSWIAPVSTQYDKVVEAESYATELLGKEKIQESLLSFLDSRKILSLKMGRVDIRFHDPWSLRQWIVTQLSSDAAISAASFPLERPLDTAQHTRLLRSLGYRVLDDINKVSVVMPTALVGTVLLTSAGQGLSMDQLTRKVDWLITKVHEAGGHIGTLTKHDYAVANNDPHFKDPRTVILNALKVLGNDLVGVQEKGLLEATYFPKDPFKLSYYRNQVIHLFVSESIACLGIFVELRRRGSTIVPKSEVHNHVKFLSTLLAGEFVFKPEGLTSTTASTIKQLQKQGVLISHEDSSDIIEMSKEELNRGCEVFDFYCFLLWPFIDGYWAASVALFALTEEPTPGKPFYKLAQSLAKTLYHEGEMTNYEAVNKEMLNVAFQHYVQRGIVIRKFDESRKEFLSLAPEWVPTRTAEGHLLREGKLFDLSEVIGIARNRPLRHGVTPSTTDRVLDLCYAMRKALTGAKL